MTFSLNFPAAIPTYRALLSEYHPTSVWAKWGKSTSAPPVTARWRKVSSAVPSCNSISDTVIVLYTYLVTSLFEWVPSVARFVNLTELVAEVFAFAVVEYRNVTRVGLLLNVLFVVLAHLLHRTTLGVRFLAWSWNVSDTRVQFGNFGHHEPPPRVSTSSRSAVDILAWSWNQRGSRGCCHLGVRICLALMIQYFWGFYQLRFGSGTDKIFWCKVDPAPICHLGVETLMIKLESGI